MEDKEELLDIGASKRKRLRQKNKLKIRPFDSRGRRMSRRGSINDSKFGMGISRRKTSNLDQYDGSNTSHRDIHSSSRALNYEVETTSEAGSATSKEMQRIADENFSKSAKKNNDIVVEDEDEDNTSLVLSQKKIERMKSFRRCSISKIKRR